MDVYLPHPFQAVAKDSFGFFICAADQEILPVFYDMCKIVIRRIASVADIDSRRAVGCAWAGGINHLAEGGIFIAFAARLDDEVRKTPVQYGIAGVYVSLVISFWRHTAWWKKGVWIKRIAEDVQCGTITGNELILTMKKVFFKFLIKSKEQAP